MFKIKKRVFGKVCIILASLIFVFATSGFIVFFKVTSGLKLDDKKLANGYSEELIKVYDKNGYELELGAGFGDKKYIKIQDVPSLVKDAFVAVEDKRFFKHNGVDFIRVFGAVLSNVKSGKFSQGASTISQQLIKNTHLNNEKTIRRKMKEIRLAYKLERRYSKEEILELYLNNIYFGNGCYGLLEASKFYFNKEPKDLSVGETAMLVGVINAPSYYNILTHQERAEKRKNIVLKIMLDNNVINNEQYEKSANNQENIVKNNRKQANMHISCVFDEVSKILNIDKKRIKNEGLVIYTSLDNAASNIVLGACDFNECVSGNDVLKGVVVVDNKTKSVVSCVSSFCCDLSKIKRQPGSVIKPIIAYAPAIEDGKLYPESIIIDEEISVDGYSPSNANKRFYGEVSLREAVEKSLNIPAVKTLSKIGVKRGKNFAKNMGVEFVKNDTNLALSLGGLTEGLTIKQIADAYSTFASGGEYSKSSFVDKIINKNGEVLYGKNVKRDKVMSDATAYIMTDILKGVSVRGTAKRLSGLGFDVASKTGTVGLYGSAKNTDAFCVSYTKDYTIVSWFGAKDKSEGMDSFINGSTYPCEINKNVLKWLYKERSPSPFVAPSSVVSKDIDTRFTTEKNVFLAEKDVDLRYRKECLFNKKHIPDIYLQNNSHKTKMQICMNYNEKPLIMFQTMKNNMYYIYRKNVYNNEEDLIFSVVGDGSSKEFLDDKTTAGIIYEYYIISHFDGDERDFQTSNKVKIMSY